MAGNGTVNAHVRNLDAQIYKRIRMLAVEREKPLAEILNEACAQYLERASEERAS